MREYGPVARTYTHTWLAINAPPRKLVIEEETLAQVKAKIPP
jgi:hypothetical protein